MYSNEKFLNNNFKKYEDFFQRIAKIKLLNKSQREEILERADNEFPKEEIIKIKKLLVDVSYNKRFYELAKILYHEGPPEEEKLFITTIADYFLRNKNELNLL